jgi:hypothetical protein
MQILDRIFTKHPASVGQSYMQHFAFSATFSIRLLIASFTALIHALLPCFFQSTTSRYIEELSRRMHRQKNGGVLELKPDRNEAHREG